MIGLFCKSTGPKMNTLVHFFILINFALLGTCFSEQNIWISSYTLNINSTERCFVKFVTRGRFGLTLISLDHPKSTLTGTLFLDSSYKKIWLQFKGNFTEMLNSPIVETNSTIINYVPVMEQVFGKLFNEIEAVLEVPFIFCSNLTKIDIGKSISSNLGFHETFKPMLGKPIPPLYQTVQVFFDNNTKSPVIPLIYNSLFMSHYGILIGIYSFFFITFIVALLLRNYQPLKSKGIIPFILL